MLCEGDVVLIYYQEHPSVFARIEFIEPDMKKGWYHITLLLLTIPVQPVTWILRDSYIDGAPFTMGGKSMRLEQVKKLPVPDSPEQEKGESSGKTRSNKAGRVIPFKKT